MTRVVPLILFLACAAAYGQPRVPEWAIVTKIKLLESTRVEVARMFPKEDFLSWGHDQLEHFSGSDAVISVEYSSGSCSEEHEEWDVPPGTATAITVTLKSRIAPKDVGIDYSRFRKERTDPQRKSIFVRYDKAEGLAISFFAGRVDSIYLFPSKADHSRLCNKSKVREYFASKRWARTPVPDRMIIDYSSPANVVDLTISPRGNRSFDISTKAIDPDYDIVTYAYFVTAGRVIGTGAKVVWDLSEAESGTHTITAAVDDGLGFAGRYLKKTVTLP